LNPIVTEPPFAGIVAFQLAAFDSDLLAALRPGAVPAALDPLRRTPGNVNVSCHGLMAVLPLLVIVIDPLENRRASCC